MAAQHAPYIEKESSKGASTGGDEGFPMPTTLTTAITRYLRGSHPARATRSEYHTTIKKWTEWGYWSPRWTSWGGRSLREFLDWVYDSTVSQEGTNPGRSSNKARDHLRAIISWAWEQDLDELVAIVAEANTATRRGGPSLSDQG